MQDATRRANKRQTTNQILLGAAVLLLALSAFTYRSSVSRADRFERGQKFLPTLDVDGVAEIVVREGIADDGKEVVLRRTADGDRFVVQSEAGYRADNGEVNRLLRKLLDLTLEKEVGEATDALAERLGVERPGEDGPADGTVEVVLRDAADQDIVRFLLGDQLTDEFAEDGASGRYLRRLSAPGKGGEAKGGDAASADTIYLTQGRVDLRADGDAFVDREILDVDRSEITTIRGDGFVFSRVFSRAPEGPESESFETGDLTLEDLAGGETESPRARSVKSVLSPLRFTSHHLADAPEVRGLVFDRALRIELADGSGYVLELARAPRDGREGGADKGTPYLRVRGFHTAQEVYIERDASEDEVRETSELLARADEIADFTEYHGSWVYEVTETVAERVGAEASELVEPAG